MRNRSCSKASLHLLFYLRFSGPVLAERQSAPVSRLGKACPLRGRPPRDFPALSSRDSPRRRIDSRAAHLALEEKAAEEQSAHLVTISRQRSGLRIWTPAREWIRSRASTRSWFDESGFSTSRKKRLGRRRRRRGQPERRRKPRKACPTAR